MDEQQTYQATSTSAVIFVANTEPTTGDGLVAPVRPIGVRYPSLLPPEDAGEYLHYLQVDDDEDQMDHGEPRSVDAFLTFSWGTLNAGDCTMFAGATWTITHRFADFNAVVRSSDDDDAWVIRSVQMRDRDGVTLQTMRNANPFPNDPYKFVQNLPDSSQRYRFIGKGRHSVYDYFNRIDHVSMTYHC